MRLQGSKPIIGHHKIVEFLEKCLAGKRVAQAYLFLGPENVGKGTVARWLIEQLVEQPLETHPDVSIVVREQDEKTKKLKQAISIEQIRALRERLSMSTFAGGQKAALIENADWMSTEASNALLKTLEEPTKDTVIILTASNEARLPQTIQSRCQVLRFGLVSSEQIAQGLVDAGVEADRARGIAELAFGRPGVAQEYVENPELMQEQEDEFEQFSKLLVQPVSARLRYTAEVLPKGSDQRAIVSKKLSFWERVLHEKFSDQVQAGQGVDHLVRALKTLHASRQALLKNTNPQLTLEHFLLNL